MTHAIIDGQSKQWFVLDVCFATALLQKIPYLQVTVTAEHSVLQLISSKSSGDRRKADKILITTEALWLCPTYRDSYILACSQQTIKRSQK